MNKKIAIFLKSFSAIALTGFFSMLPGMFFVAIFYFLSNLTGIEHFGSESVIFLYGGCCGGAWLMKKLTLLQVEKMPDKATKMEILEKMKFQ